MNSQQSRFANPKTVRLNKRVALLLLCVALFSGIHTASASECVILLHGLARTAGSMSPIEDALLPQGYTVVNSGYSSRSGPISQLAVEAINPALRQCEQLQASKVHFVSHSLGGILIRYYLANNKLENLGRVVMLAPPNKGSEVVDDWRDVPGFEMAGGAAGAQLGTGADSVPLSLGPVEFELGVIAGNTSYNPILSMSLPKPHDGKVSVESARVEGMKDFLVVPFTHTFMMRAEVVIEQVLYFIKQGAFEHQRIET